MAFRLREVLLGVLLGVMAGPLNGIWINSTFAETLPDAGSYELTAASFGEMLDALNQSQGSPGNAKVGQEDLGIGTGPCSPEGFVDWGATLDVGACGLSKTLTLSAWANYNESILIEGNGWHCETTRYTWTKSWTFPCSMGMPNPILFLRDALNGLEQDLANALKK